MRSLSRTLVLGTTLAAAVILVSAGASLYVLVRASLLKQFDRSMLDKAQLLASTIEQERGELVLEFDELDMREFEGQALGREGQPLAWVAGDELVQYSFPAANVPIVEALAALEFSAGTGVPDQ